MTNTIKFDIDILIENDAWQTQCPELEDWARLCLGAANKRFCQKPFTEVSVLFTDNNHVQILNKTYRDQDKPTNVLSFPMAVVEGEEKPLGDIVLALGVVGEEAKRADLMLKHHIAHLLIHGYLHLQGLDHETEAEAAEMEKLEILVLQDLGLANPYARISARIDS